MNRLKQLQILRMGQWLIAANVLYLLALAPWSDTPFWPPQVQTGLLAGANCALGSWIAFWIDRAAFKRFDSLQPENISENAHLVRLLCRAVLLAAGMLACNLKLG